MIVDLLLREIKKNKVLWQVTKETEGIVFVYYDDHLLANIFIKYYKMLIKTYMREYLAQQSFIGLRAWEVELWGVYKVKFERENDPISRRGQYK